MVDAQAVRPIPLTSDKLALHQQSAPTRLFT
jgi:hypothetical protein